MATIIFVALCALVVGIVVGGVGGMWLLNKVAEIELERWWWNR